ncbi:uncharacterized protein PGTG_13270 [Puccinia graminis f. sp. tritici CRL 75-36-700-3]|uniref:RNase P subunit p30 n=1 Tax=Puccinia graminis f. sp. tritici (strain CRL 75-36-700-3 / race SCCL) TaxID=418459 RepID=E3KRX6_PUCGT|nr:uncharacterized protein PGTG_13270 [Puccinia graminis f. sp. tritici CRL 75-36-700-3]EFP87051.1 hypothetical protein PGTG_13270 [Puccinia graminis f. sp. tritici CRL 75-36-700-3]
MYVDLNIPWPTSHLTSLLQTTASTGSRKGKQKANNTTSNTNGSSSKTNTLDIWKGVSREEREGLRETVECAIRLGYSVVAFNLVIPQSLDPLQLQPHFPFPSDAPPFPDLDPRTVESDGSTKTVLQLSRLTMVMDEHVAGNAKGVFGFSKSQTSYLGRYSLLSAMPLDAASFAHACLSLSAPSPTGIDLISFDLGASPKLPFIMPLSTVSNALKQGVLFEAIYSPTTSLNSFRSHSSSGLPVSASSSTCRRNLISVLKEIIRVTNCAHGLVVSSGAARWAELRAPGDVINLLNVLGISHENGRKAMTTNPKMLVSRAMSTRQTHKAVISNPVIVSSSSPAGASKRPLPPSDSLDPPVLVQGFKYTDTSNDKDLKRLKT